MSLWGNKDSKTITGTVAVTNGAGTLTGTSTAFTTAGQLKTGQTVVIGNDYAEYRILTVSSATAATFTPVFAGSTAAGLTITANEQPAYISTGDMSSIYFADTNEQSSGGNIVNTVQVLVAGTKYAQIPLVTLSAPPTNTVATASVSVANDTITITNHKFAKAAKLTYANGGGASITGLSTATEYFVIPDTVNTFKLASSAANAIAGTVINLTGTGNAAQTFTGVTATADAVLTSLAVSSLTITEAGSGYNAGPPTVTIQKSRLTIPTSGITTTNTELVEFTAHGLTAEESVTYYNGGGSSATGLTTATAYYVANAGLTANVFKLKAAATTLTLTGFAITNTSGSFSCTASTLSVGDRVTITGTYAGTGSITSYTTGTVYKVSATNGTTTGTLTTEAAGALTTTAGTPTGLTLKAETVIDLSGTGNNAQYFEKTASTTATSTAALGSGEAGTHIIHSGWVRRTVGTGGRAGRVNWETLVAMGTPVATSSDAVDDTILPD